MKDLVIIAGPTATGKTRLSIELAKRIGGSIISADSMQVYKGMDIGTAKITPEQMQGIPHYLIDILDPKDDFNIVMFQEKAGQAIDEICRNGRIPIITGGTGFYIQSILYDIDFTESEELVSYRRALTDLIKEKGGRYVHNMLEAADPEAAERIHHNDSKRMIRALEYHEQTGRKISEHNDESAKRTSPYNFCYFVLNYDRSRIYARINERVDKMIDDGLVEEVRKLKDAGLTKDNVSMHGLGYKEIIDHLEGNCTLEEAVYKIKLETRHFAKRQITWFKREKDTIMLENGPDDTILDRMIVELKKKGIINE